MSGAGRRLILLRHSKSDRHADVDDHGRPLAERGRAEAPLAGRWLRDRLAGLDLVVCSTAARARETWELAGAEFDTEPSTRHDERLYAASADGLLTVVRELPDSARSVLFVAHNPGLEDLVTVLTGSREQLRTSAIAVLDSPAGWSDGGGGWARLTSLTTPRP